ncbi:MAG: hypothetical protein EP329_17250 [Deltaproteobacteria bacterium]|nr:MAG: hypothetical protein EP329_17250 [Deltaproteobacteria bacterium]
MSACSQTKRAIAQAISLGDLPEAHAAHAAACPECGGLLNRYRHLDRVTRRTRRVLETEVDLSPNDWVRVREGIDRAVTRRRPVLPMLLAGAVTIAAVVLAFVIVRGGQAAETGRTSALALDQVESPSAPQVAVAPPATPEVMVAAEGGKALAVAAGDVLAAGDAPRTLDAFGRHHVTLSANSQLRVLDWAADKMALEVVSGEVTCDVNRTLDEDVFEVRSGDVTVHVLGTVFSVARDAEGSTRVAVTRGRVGVLEGTGAMRELGAGESMTVSAASTALVDPTEARHEPRAVRHTPRTPRVIQIDVPDQGMDKPLAEGWTSSRAYAAIVAAIEGGRCETAMKALDAAVDASRGALPAGEIAKLRARCAE